MKQNNKLSLCRKFSRWNRFHDDDISRVLMILFVVLCIIICMTINNKYGYELESYNKDHYKYLTAIVYTIWDEDTKSLKIEYIPDNVKITEANASPSGTNFNCSLTSKTSLLPAPFVNVHISEDFNVEVTHYTESEFRSSAKVEFVMFCVACCVLCLLAEMVVWWLIKLAIFLFCGVCDFIRLFITEIQQT